MSAIVYDALVSVRPLMPRTPRPALPISTATLLALLAAGALSGCACEGPGPSREDAGGRDAGQEDAGPDAGTRDAGPDAGTRDAGPDAGGADPYAEAPGIWPITASADPGCVQDSFGHRLLSGSDDFHPGWDTCDDDPDDIDGGSSGAIVGLPVHAIAAGVVSRVRLWDPAWDADPGACPSFCRQGNFLLIRHPELEPLFGGQVVQSIYMHLAQDTLPSELTVGAAVSAGQELGRVGNTGTDINTVHLHFGLLVGSAEGRIDFDDYVNPLRVLPYPRPVPPSLSLLRERGAAAFDAGECPAAEGGSDLHRTVALRIEEPTPAFDTLRVELTPEGGGEAMVLDIDARIGVGIDGAQDDFAQGCVQVSVEDFREGSPVRALTVRFGGAFDASERFLVTRIDARGIRSEATLEAPTEP